VTVVDPSDVALSSIAEARPGDTISLVGVRTHLLPAGATLDLQTREPSGALPFLDA
jgi:cyanophycinase